MLASEQSLLEIDAVEARKMDKCKDLRDFDKNQTVMVNSVRASLIQQVLWGVSSMQWSLPTKSGLRKDNWWTNNKGHGRTTLLIEVKRLVHLVLYYKGFVALHCHISEKEKPLCACPHEIAPQKSVNIL